MQNNCNNFNASKFVYLILHAANASRELKDLDIIFAPEFAKWILYKFQYLLQRII